MKTWNTPELKELTLSATEKGQGFRHVDYSFKDQYGFTFESHSGFGNDSENREDRVPHNP